MFLLGSWKSAIWHWSFIWFVYTSILICHCMDASIRFEDLFWTELGDLQPCNYRGLILFLTAALRIV